MVLPAIWMSSIIYASLITVLSIGFTLTYLTAKIPNFAHGTYAGIGIYTSFTVARVFYINPYLSAPLSFILGGGISVLIFVLVIGAIQRIGGGAIVQTIATLAIQIFMTAALSIYAYWLQEVYRKYTMPFMLKENDFELFGMPGIFTFALVFCVATVITLHYLLTRTKTGISMRATAEDPELSSVLGINTYRIQLFSWYLTGSLACFAGTLLPMYFASYPTTGAAMITSIMAGSLLGGLESIYGAIFGGFVVGVSELLITYWLQGIVGVWIGEYRPMVPMFFLIAILLTEPRGLHGIYERFMASKAGGRLKSTMSRGKVETKS